MSGEELSRGELEALGAVIERLIPSDAHGPGAREARVARYIVGRLAGPYREHRATYSQGLARLDADALVAHGAAFARLAPEAQDELLRAAEARDGDPFFDLVLAHALEGMFGDPSHGGNADRVGWQLMGYPGPRHVWTESDQALGRAEAG